MNSMSKSREWIGLWKTERPLTQEQYDQDSPILETLITLPPRGVVLHHCEVRVNGRLYEWRQQS